MVLNVIQHQHFREYHDINGSDHHFIFKTKTIIGKNMEL